MTNIFFRFLITCLIFTILSCGKTTEENVIDAVSNTSENIEGILEDNNDTAVDFENSLTGGSFGSCDNSKVFIVGNAIKQKGCYPNCPKLQAVIWNLEKCMTLLGESSGVVDAAEHGGSIYIADDGGYYWIVRAGNSITKQSLNHSGYKLSEVSGIDVNSNGDVYVAGMVVQNGRGGKAYTSYWKNGELVKTFRENADWYSEKHVAADSKGNVFIPGFRMKTHEVIYSALWINGTRKNLTTSHDGEATDVVIGTETSSGSNVWISGAHGPYTRGGTLAAYWRRKPNGQTNQTKVTKVRTYNSPKGWVYSSRASSIFVEGSTVYMAGVVNVINAGDVPVYWKAKTQHELQLEFNLNTCDYCRAEPKDIVLYEGKVLVVGDYYDRNDFVDSTSTNGEDKAVYWLDKKLNKLCIECASSYAAAVVLMD